MYGFGLFYTMDGKEKNANFCTEINGLFGELNGSRRTRQGILIHAEEKRLYRVRNAAGALSTA